MLRTGSSPSLVMRAARAAARASESAPPEQAASTRSPAARSDRQARTALRTSATAVLGPMATSGREAGRGWLAGKNREVGRGWLVGKNLLPGPATAAG